MGLNYKDNDDEISVFLVMFCFGFAVQAFAEDNAPTLPKAPYVSIETAKEWVANKRDFLFVDVRRPDEYALGHLPALPPIVGPLESTTKR